MPSTAELVARVHALLAGAVRRSLWPVLTGGIPVLLSPRCPGLPRFSAGSCRLRHRDQKHGSGRSPVPLAEHGAVHPEVAGDIRGARRILRPFRSAVTGVADPAAGRTAC